MATSPYQIIAGPAKVYIAPVGTAFPAVDADPTSGGWTYLGFTEGGVNIAHNQSVELLRADQSTGPLKAIRSEEELHITFSLAELTLENYAKALNDVTVTDVAPGTGTAGYREIKVRMGFDVKPVALLVRGPSPYGDGWNLQFEVPIAVQTGEPEVSFVRDDKTVLEVDFVALEDLSAASDDARFGRLIAQDADAL